ncbi:MAG TPA: 3-isopropylmalate dehydratase small subunit, partial [Xanthobacteraceae bacterium]|nr:3-isopropylmalate dehydratase small subunit [Xanthobacteraceae bacterium]
DPHRKHCLLEGLDDIGLTMVKQDKIERFEERSTAARPWV